eukprot:CAMPEP_0171103590 /NCGR_PEP_ID=MMETSP0766_2-20121228/59002_1 /TAXON_ID=439317 /ORGANISM="Gambierdiscus australes, Strain CAWD 149" /LENGTH=329 /DNA_ID=CAMNT_0011564031 /DNA_START=42 /DNA_END=1031 /DNA_ORIENTATION=-
MPQRSARVIMVGSIAFASSCALTGEPLFALPAPPAGAHRMNRLRRGTSLAGSDDAQNKGLGAAFAGFTFAGAALLLVGRSAAAGEPPSNQVQEAAAAAEAEAPEAPAKPPKRRTQTLDWKRANPEAFKALDTTTRMLIEQYAYVEEWNENPEKFKKPFQPSEQLGGTAPLGFFDPLGFTSDGEKETFRRYREHELKHGRVAMMASLGAVVQCYIKLPGFTEVPSGVGALVTPPGPYGLLALLIVTGALEIYLKFNPVKEKYSLNLDVGEPSNRIMFFIGDDFIARDYFYECELNNGRLAMFTALGIITAELVSGRTAIQQFEPLLRWKL